MTNSVSVSTYKPKITFCVEGERSMVQVAHLEHFLVARSNNTVDFRNPTNAFTYAVHLIQSDELYIRGLDRFVLFVISRLAAFGQTLGASDTSNFMLKAYTEVARACIKQQMFFGNIRDVNPAKENYNIIISNDKLKTIFDKLPYEEQWAICVAENLLEVITSNTELNTAMQKLQDKEKWAMFRQIPQGDSSADEEITL